MDDFIKVLALQLASQAIAEERGVQEDDFNNYGVFVGGRCGNLKSHDYQLDSTLSLVLTMLGLAFIAAFFLLVLKGVKAKVDVDNAHEKRLKAVGFDLDSLESGHDYLCPIGLRVMVDPVWIQYSPNERSNISYEREMINKVETCPVTRRKIAGLAGNQLLKQEIEAWVSSKEILRVNKRCPTLVSFFNKKQVAGDDKPFGGEVTFPRKLAP